MVISSFISSILVLAIGIWAYLRLESSMNTFAERQLLIEPSKFSYKMWKDMPVTMYQSFTFFNLTNWNQVKAVGQKPRFVEVGPYVYRTSWTKSDINFLDEEKLINFGEKKQWHFQPHLSRGHEDDQIWTINTPLMTALALIQNAPVITRNIVSVILDGLGEGAFIRRPIRSLLFEGYSDLIVSVGPLFDRRFSNFNGKFAYLYNKNDSIDGVWTVSTGTDDLSTLNKITRFQNPIVNMTSFSSGQLPQGLNEVKPECAPAWSLDQATNGQLFAPFNRDIEQIKLQNQLQQLEARTRALAEHPPQQTPRPSDSIVQAPKRFFSRSGNSENRNTQHQHHHHHHHNQQQQQQQQRAVSSVQDQLNQLRDFGKYIFYPDLCRPIHLLPSVQEVTSENGIQASRYFIDPRVFMNSTQVPANKCYEMNPRPPLANALAATINSVTGANVNVPNLVTSASNPFAIFIPPNNNNHHHHHNHHDQQTQHHLNGGLFERSNHHPNSFLNNALHSLGATADQLAASSSNNTPIGRLGRVRQLFSNIVSQRMSAAGPLLPSLASGPAGLLMGNHNNHHHHSQPHSLPPFGVNARNAPDLPVAAANSPLLAHQQSLLNNSNRQPSAARADEILAGNPQLDPQFGASVLASGGPIDEKLQSTPNNQHLPSNPIVGSLPSLAANLMPQPNGGSDRWITQFRFKWPRGVFSIGQCQLGAPIYVSLPHFLDADEYYLEQVDGLRPNRSLHEFYIDVESTLHSIPVNAKARLQLNVATPELRFRNIPNAMIPVLWQEVTFKIDKPVASMLFWSFTMSSTIYKSISVLLLILGNFLLVWSFVGTFKRRQPGLRRPSEDRITIAQSQSPSTQVRRQSSRASSRQSSSDHSSYASSQHNYLQPHLHHHQHQHQIHEAQSHEGLGSSWQPHMLHMTAAASQCELARACATTVGNMRQLSKEKLDSKLSGGGTLDSVRRHGGVLNHAFSSCNELQQHDHKSSGSEPAVSCSNNSITLAGSRASSHCGLMPSLGAATTMNCAGCLLACLRHSSNTNQVNPTAQQHQPNRAPHIHEESIETSGASDTSLVRQKLFTTSDTDKGTLSSIDSNLADSCSFIYPTQRTRTFRPSNSKQEMLQNYSTVKTNK